jgi:hypothetical protein
MTDTKTKTGWPPGPLAQDDDAALSRWLARRACCMCWRAGDRSTMTDTTKADAQDQIQRDELQEFLRWNRGQLQQRAEAMQADLNSQTRTIFPTRSRTMNDSTKPDPLDGIEPRAWLHTVQTARNDFDASLSFSRDNFPLSGMVESIAVEPLYTRAAILSAIERARADERERCALPPDLHDYLLSHLCRERAALDGFLAFGNEVVRAARHDRWIAALATTATGEQG